MSQSVNGKENYKNFDRRIKTPVKNTSFFHFHLNIQQSKKKNIMIINNDNNK